MEAAIDSTYALNRSTPVDISNRQRWDVQLSRDVRVRFIQVAVQCICTAVTEFCSQTDVNPTGTSTGASASDRDLLAALRRGVGCTPQCLWDEQNAPHEPTDQQTCDTYLVPLRCWLTLAPTPALLQQTALEWCTVLEEHMFLHNAPCRRRYTRLARALHSALRNNWAFLLTASPDLVATFSIAQQQFGTPVWRDRSNLERVEAHFSKLDQTTQHLLDTTAGDGAYQCTRCNKYHVTWYPLQQRSADEPPTIWCYCQACGNKWHIDDK